MPKRRNRKKRRKLSLRRRNTLQKEAVSGTTNYNDEALLKLHRFTSGLNPLITLRKVTHPLT